jgi:hypothetical protein
MAEFSARRVAATTAVAATALVLAACGGGPSTPHVASLEQSSNNHSGGTPTTASTGNPTPLLVEWTTCIRSNGDPNQVDPTIDSNDDIDITMNNVSQTLENEVHGSTGPCSNYLLAAENALRGGQPSPPAPDAAQEATYADCMRTHGVPNFPNPNSATGETDFNGTGVDPNSPSFQKADKVCTEAEGEKYYPPGSEEPGVVKVTGINGPGNGGPPPSDGVHVPSGNSGSAAVRVPVTNG